MSAKWQKFTKSQKQRDELHSAHRVKFLRCTGGETGVLTAQQCWPAFDEVTHYMICEPLPHHMMRIEHASTGREVEFSIADNEWEDIAEPSWYEEETYRFKPVEPPAIEKEKMVEVKIEGQDLIDTLTANKAIFRDELSKLEKRIDVRLDKITALVAFAVIALVVISTLLNIIT